MPSTFPKKPDQETPLGKRALTGTFVKVSVPKGPASTTLRQLAKSSISGERQNNEVVRADFPQTWRTASGQRLQGPTLHEPNQMDVQTDKSVPDTNPAGVEQTMSGGPALIPVRPDQAVPLGVRALKGTFVDITLPASAETLLSTFNTTKPKVPPVPDQTASLGSKAVEGTFVHVTLPANANTNLSNLNASKKLVATPDQSVPLGARAHKGTFVDIALPVSAEPTVSTSNATKAKYPPPDQTARLGSKALEGTFVDVTVPTPAETKQSKFDASKKISTLPDQAVSLGSRAIKGTFVSVSLPASASGISSISKVKVPPPDQTAPLGSKAVEGTFVDVTLLAKSKANEYKLNASRKMFSVKPDQSVSLGSRAIKGTFVDVAVPVGASGIDSTSKVSVPPRDQTAPLASRALEGTFVDVTLPTAPETKEFNLDASKKISKLPDQSVSLGSRAIQGTFVNVSLPVSASGINSTPKVKVPPPDQTAPLGSKALEGTLADVTLLAKSKANESKLNARKIFSVKPDQSVSLGSRAVRGTFVDVALPVSASGIDSTSKVSVPPPDQTAPLGSRALEGTFVDVTLPTTAESEESKLDASKKISTLPDQSVSLGSRAIQGTFVDITLPERAETMLSKPKEPPSADQATSLENRALDGTFVNVPFPARNPSKMDSTVPASANKVSALPDQSAPLATRALMGTFVNVTMPTSSATKMKSTASSSIENVSVLPDQARPIGSLASKGTFVENTLPSRKATNDDALRVNHETIPPLSDPSGPLAMPILGGGNVEKTAPLPTSKTESAAKPSTKVPPQSEPPMRAPEADLPSYGLPEVILDNGLNENKAGSTGTEPINALYERAAQRQNEKGPQADQSMWEIPESTSFVRTDDDSIQEKLSFIAGVDESPNSSHQGDDSAVNSESTAETEPINVRRPQSSIEGAERQGTIEDIQSSIEVAPIDLAIQEAHGAEDTFENDDEPIQNNAIQAPPAINVWKSQTTLSEKARGKPQDGSTRDKKERELPDELTLETRMESPILHGDETSLAGQQISSSGTEQGIVDAREVRLLAEGANSIEAAPEPRMRVKDEAPPTIPEEISPGNMELENPAEMGTDDEEAEHNGPSLSTDHPLSQDEHETHPPSAPETSNQLLNGEPIPPQDEVKVEEGDLISTSGVEFDVTSMNLEDGARNQKIIPTEDVGKPSMELARQAQQQEQEQSGPLKTIDHMGSLNVASLENAEVRLVNSNRFGRKAVLTSRLNSDKRGQLSIPDQSKSFASRAIAGTFVDVVVTRTNMPTNSFSNSVNKVPPSLPPLVAQHRVDQDPRKAMIGQINNSARSTNRQKDSPGQPIEPKRQMKPDTSPSPRRRKVWKQIPSPGGFRLVQVEEDIVEVADAKLFKMVVNSTAVEDRATNTTEQELMNLESTHSEQQNIPDEEGLHESEPGTVMALKGTVIEEINIAEEIRRQEEERMAKQEKAKAAVAKIKAFFEEQEPSHDSIVDQWLNYEKRWGALPSASNALNEEEKELIKKRAKYYFARDIVGKDEPDHAPTVEGTLEERQSLTSDPSEASTSSQKPTPFFAQRSESTSQGSPESR